MFNTLCVSLNKIKKVMTIFLNFTMFFTPPYQNTKGNDPRVPR
jgi:hypothetical protein